MKIWNNIVRVWVVIAFAVLAVIAHQCYWPFVQLENIDAEYHLGSFDSSLHDRIVEFKKRCELYIPCRFLHKGDHFSDLPLLNCKDASHHQADIIFNWDNSISIIGRTHKFDLHVDRIVVEPQLYPFSDNDYWYKQHDSEDSLFVGIFMYDKDNNEIDVYRQNKKMPYGGKPVGFRVKIGGEVFVTGIKERFNY